MTLQPTPVLVKKAKKKEGERVNSFFFVFLVLSFLLCRRRWSRKTRARE